LTAVIGRTDESCQDEATMRVLPALAALLTLAAAQAPSTASILGRWTNPKGGVTVAIAPCGAALCGTVVAASEKARADARKGGTTELIGATLLSNVVPDGKGQWKSEIFVPDLNIRTQAQLVQIAPDKIKVTGCAAGGLICKSQIWTRAS
jgi:uncharacterized protein (DUF2147 family)